MIFHRFLISGCVSLALLMNSLRGDELPNAVNDQELWKELVAKNQPEAERVWIRGEYLVWLISSGKALKAAQEADFQIPPAAKKLLRGESIGPVSLEKPFGDNRQGYRLTAGAWIDDEHIFGVDGSLMYLTRGAGRLLVKPGDTAVLGDVLGLTVGVPVVARKPLRIEIIPVRIPDLVKGGLAFDFGSKTLFGGELAGRFGLIKGDDWRIDGLLGYRYLDYQEAFRVYAGVSTVAKFLNPGTTIISRDEITTQNNYNGLLLGFQADAQFDSWTISARPRVSIVVADREVTRQGETSAIIPGEGRFIKQEGTYLLKQDIGTFSASEITAIPELDLGLAYAITPNLRLMVGTSGMFIPAVAKAANQLQLGIRPERIPAGLSSKVDSLPPMNSGEPPIRNSLILFTWSLGLELRF